MLEIRGVKKLVNEFLYQTQALKNINTPKNVTTSYWNISNTNLEKILLRTVEAL
jgi:hypothetical protein